MKTFLIAMTVLSALSGFTAKGSTVSDTIVVEHPDRVTIINQKNGYKAVFDGKPGAPDYRHTYSRQFGADSLEVIRETNDDNDFNISIPFSRYWKKKRNGHRYSPHWEGLGFGFCNAVQTAKGGLNGPDGVSTNMGRSYEISFNFSSAAYRLGRGFGVFTGIGINWRNFRMDNAWRFVKEDNKTHLEGYPEGAEIKFSRLKVFSITVPYMVEWQSNTKHTFFINAGVLFNLNAYASYKTRYKLDGKDVKEMIHDVHQVPTTVDFMGQLGYRAFSFYVKYSPSRLIQEDYGPKMQAFSCGVMLQF